MGDLRRTYAVAEEREPTSESRPSIPCKFPCFREKSLYETASSANESYECKSLCQKDLEFSPFPPKFGDSSQGISAFHTRESPQVELCSGEILHSGNEEYRSAMEPVRREV